MATQQDIFSAALQLHDAVHKAASEEKTKIKTDDDTQDSELEGALKLYKIYMYSLAGPAATLGFIRALCSEDDQEPVSSAYLKLLSEKSPELHKLTVNAISGSLWIEEYNKFNAANVVNDVSSLGELVGNSYAYAKRTGENLDLKIAGRNLVLMFPLKIKTYENSIKDHINASKRNRFFKNIKAIFKG